MTIPVELEAQILRLYHAEKWPCGTIAKQSRVHRETVQRVIAHAGLHRIGPQPKPSMIEPYLPFIRQTLTKYPTLTASRLYMMVRERGYKGAPHHFRHLISLHRPRKPAEAFLRLRTLPGEQAQVDWGHFCHIEIGRARRPLMAFVMVLSYSRDIYLRFFLDARMENFLRGHIGAFNTCGLPRVLLYDNLKSAVLERVGDAIRFHPTLLAFAGHYRFEPQPVAVARGNEKGHVERATRHVREACFAARKYTDLDDLNAQAEQWCRTQAADRPCPEDRTMTVRADLNQVRVFDGAEMIASHRRCYDRAEQIEDPQHLKTLEQFKREARQHRGVNSLPRAVPACELLLIRAANVAQASAG
ncbi:IS21 family transposase [Burkholderia ubonensis]|uniref:IS21 family transposase n=1 Tax=Burkholderia ubonensis TaxID=101571 RepID=UPI000AC1FF39|nr:IS21 family transposase [Burkholderia ubonensis]